MVTSLAHLRLMVTRIAEAENGGDFEGAYRLWQQLDDLGGRMAHEELWQALLQDLFAGSGCSVRLAQAPRHAFQEAS